MSVRNRMMQKDGRGDEEDFKGTMFGAMEYISHVIKHSAVNGIKAI